MSINGSAALRLISVPVSPYCELGRWALDWLGLTYTEEAHAPALHLPIRDSAIRAWSAGGVSPFEWLLVRLLFPLLAALVRRSLDVGPDTIRQRRAEIDAAFAQVEALLADGRHYLMGDRFTAESAAELVDAAQRRGRIDVVSDLTRVVPVRLRYRALQAADGLRDSMRAEIVRRKALAGTPGQPDDILGRLLALQDESRPWLDDETIRRNLAGLVLGAVDTTSKFTTLALDELPRRPDALRAARTAALGNDLETVRRYAWEAVRFNPHHAFQVRQAARDCVLAAGTPRARRIPASATVLLAILSAMFDPDAIVQPDAFRTDRSIEYLHFGVGLHACLGRSIDAVQVPELLAALLRVPGLRRAPGRAGEVVYDGPFPDRLLVDVEAAR